MSCPLMNTFQPLYFLFNLQFSILELFLYGVAFDSISPVSPLWPTALLSALFIRYVGLLSTFFSNGLSGFSLMYFGTFPTPLSSFTCACCAPLQSHAQSFAAETVSVWIPQASLFSSRDVNLSLVSPGHPKIYNNHIHRYLHYLRSLWLWHLVIFFSSLTILRHPPVPPAHC